MALVDSDIPEIIRLQLRKPKSWSWQLSTSKSSPHITLPIIQLYDYKGELLVEAVDEGKSLTKSWSSSTAFSKDDSLRNTKVVRAPSDKLIRRSRSDTVAFKDEKYPSKTSLVSTRSENLTENLGPRRHRRTKSDDMFRRKLLKTSEESIKRAEQDGYRNFITPHIPNEEPEKPDKIKKTRKLYGGGDCQQIVNGSASKLEISDINARRYTTRTSSAGTLIIPLENYPLPRRRRRWLTNDLKNDIETSTASVTSPAFLNDIQRNRQYVRYTSDPAQDRRARSRSAGGWPAINNQVEKTRERHRHTNSPSRSRIPHSRSDVFPFRELLTEKNEEKFRNNKSNNDWPPPPAENPHHNGRFGGGIGGAILEESDPGRRKNRHGRNGDGSIAAEKGEGNDQMKGNKAFGNHSLVGHLLHEHSLTKKPPTEEHPGPEETPSTTSTDCELLRLVRTLSATTCDAKGRSMGANVSRHSAKGLGRRSHSSGSICNSKSGRHAGEGKMCGSLPSYLDDEHEEGGCNNNHHDCGEKVGIDEVDRIPPIGDAGPGLHWKFSENSQGICLADQGYGSERSPEEEYPPSLPGEHHLQCHRHLDPHACYPFVTPESTFVVKLTKGSRGLGLSVTGGIESGGSWPGLIRIKRLFPHQPASACALLNVGDLLLEANGVSLTGLTNYEALEVLRTASNQVELKVCRPPPDVLNCVSPISEVPPPPPRREPPNTLNLSNTIFTTPEDDYYHGEYDITLKKIHGSLGFTLRKEDDSALGHYVRALVREPALTDGRIKAGDKIIAVNDVEICNMSHEQAVQFLRQCPELVKLRLYRDSAQTPVATLSPSETTPRTSFSKKTHLRQEAVDMLNDLAAGRIATAGINQDFYTHPLSPNESLRRLHRQNCASDASQNTDCEQFHEGLLQKCSHPFDEDAFNSLFSIESDDGDKPSRPSSLELYNPNQTPVATRKPRFNFSLAHNAYELNNLDPEVLDAPNLTYNLGNEEIKIIKQDSQEPMSMPHISATTTFSYKNPAYQSAHPQIGSDVPEPAPVSFKIVEKVKNDVQIERHRSKSPEERHYSQPEHQYLQQMPPLKESYEVLAIELNRGWNSRLGFSLQGAAGVTYVSAVHADSVAARDGRLRPGDRLIKVNDESIDHMTTSEIIDLLRIVRGPVCVVVSRVKSNEDCPKSNAEN